MNVQGPPEENDVRSPAALNEEVPREFAKDLWPGEIVSFESLVPGVWRCQTECAGGFIIDTGVTGSRVPRPKSLSHSRFVQGPHHLLAFNEESESLLVLLFVPGVLEEDYRRRCDTWSALRQRPHHDSFRDFLDVFPTLSLWRKALVRSYEEGVRLRLFSPYGASPVFE